MGQGEIKGVKRRPRVGGGVCWQFHARDEKECWMAIYRAERERVGKRADTEILTGAKSRI